MFTNAKNTDTPYPSDTPTMPPMGSNLAPQAATLIARGVKVEGEFKSQGDVVIEGDVQGIINAVGTLTVGPEAHIKANVTADEAIISGTVDGNLTIKKQAVLHSSARIKGDLTAERITVESGATMEGKVQIGSPSIQASVKPRQEDATGSGEKAASNSVKTPPVVPMK